MFPSWKKASGLVSPLWCTADPQDIWDHNVDEHRAFKAQLLTAFLYVKECRSALKPAPPILVMPDAKEIVELNVSSAPTFDSSKPFDPAALQKQMEGWIAPLVQHLTDEIATLKPEYMEKIGEKEHHAVEKRTEKHLQSYDPSWFFVSALGESLRRCLVCSLRSASTDWESGHRLVPLPLFVRKVLVPVSLAGLPEPYVYDSQFAWAPKHKQAWRYAPYPEVKNSLVALSHAD